MLAAVLCDKGGSTSGDVGRAQRELTAEDDFAPSGMAHGAGTCLSHRGDHTERGAGAEAVALLEPRLLAPRAEGHE